MIQFSSTVMVQPHADAGEHQGSHRYDEKKVSGMTARLSTLLQLLDTEEHPLTIFGHKCHYILRISKMFSVFNFMYGCAGLCCCMWAFSSCREGDPLQPCADFSLWFLLLQKPEAVVPVLGCLSECGILPAQGSNPRPPCLGRQTLFFFFFHLFLLVGG